MRSDSERAALAYWRNVSGAWHMTPPRKPADEDIDWYRRSLGRALDPGAPTRALMLGVTPELTALPWPASGSLVALDWSAGMLQLWAPPKGAGWSGAVCSDWRHMPLASGSRDVALSDGIYTVIGNFEAGQRVAAELRRVLRPGALYCSRTFLRPAQADTVDGLFSSLESGAARDSHFFRWGLAMALQGASRSGVMLREVWSVWRERVGEGRELAARNGWSEAERAGIENWQNARFTFFFPSLADMEELCRPHFEILSCELPGYAWPGCHCRMVMKAR